MSSPLRSFAASRILRVLAVCAWLMLLVTSVNATPMSSTARDSSALNAAKVTAMKAMPGMQVSAAVHDHADTDCCVPHGDGGHAASAHCHCASPCSALLILPGNHAVGVLASMTMDDLRFAAAVPHAATRPLLRPPVA